MPRCSGRAACMRACIGCRPSKAWRRMPAAPPSTAEPDSGAEGTDRLLQVAQRPLIAGVSRLHVQIRDAEDRARLPRPRHRRAPGVILRPLVARAPHAAARQLGAETVV